MAGGNVRLSRWIIYSDTDRVLGIKRTSTSLVSSSITTCDSTGPNLIRYEPSSTFLKAGSLPALNWTTILFYPSQMRNVLAVVAVVTTSVVSATIIMHPCNNFSGILSSRLYDFTSYPRPYDCTALSRLDDLPRLSCTRLYQRLLLLRCFLLCTWYFHLSRTEPPKLSLKLSRFFVSPLPPSAIWLGVQVRRYWLLLLNAIGNPNSSSLVSALICWDFNRSWWQDSSCGFYGHGTKDFSTNQCRWGPWHSEAVWTLSYLLSPIY